MPAFRWKGRGPDGRIVQGELQAPTKEEVLRKLKSTRIMPIEIVEHTEGGEPPDPDGNTRRPPVLLIGIGVLLVILILAYWFLWRG